MGMDLRLLPFDADSAIKFSHTIINLGRNYELFDEINKLKQSEVPDDFTSFLGRSQDGETCYGLTIETPYGNRVTYVRAGDLCELPVHLRRDREKPTWAYLEALPPNTKVALYWH